MKHLGDIMKINGAEIEPVDVIVGGSPCQDLSVAGKRVGLDGQRSGLFMEQLRVIKEMRDESNSRSDNPIRPRYMVWENVPGAFSSNHAEDFRIVLEETARVADSNAAIPRPPKNKWATAGCIMGDGWSIAWRVQDAQFWGVPQRRRRIALVADFGGLTAPEILFERKGVSGDITESGTEREGTAGDTERGVAYAVRMREGCSGGGKGPLIQKDKSGTLSCGNDQTIFSSYGVVSKGNGEAFLMDEQHMSLACGGGQAGQGYPAVMTYSIGGYNSEGILSPNPHAGIYEADTSRTLDLNGGNPACNQGGIAVVERPTLFAPDGIAATLDASFASKWGLENQHVNAGCPNFVKQPVAFYQHKFGEYREGAGTLKTNCGQPSNGSGTLAVSVDCRNMNESEIHGTLQAKENGGQSLNYMGAVRTGYAVRRLTPLECERLQGFPDGWTEIIFRNKPASDSVRYKALGNSIALPPWRFVLGRIYKHGARTLGSLFDGIGGFPLVWSEFGGETLWASEIEPFPIAVTSLRLNGGN